MSQLLDFSSKKQVFEFLEEKMSGASSDLYEKGRLGVGSYLLKSYVIEVNSHVNGDIDIQELIKMFLDFIFPEKSLEIKQVDADLVAIEDIDKELLIFVEVRNRFWFLHSVSRAERVDHFVRNLQKHPAIDRMWMWDEFLRGMITEHERIFKGFSIDYDNRSIMGEEEAQSSYTKMQIWGYGSKLLRLFEDVHRALGDMSVLGKIRFKEGDSEEDYIITDIKWDGKVKSHGTSIIKHYNILRSLVDKYATRLQTIENNRLAWGSFPFPSGHPFYIIFEEPIDEHTFYRLKEKMFTGKNPFRLLGFGEDVLHKGYVVSVVDMHIGKSFRMQMFPDMFALYVDENVCGNTVIRLFANLQHTIGRRIFVESEGKRILGE